MSFLGVDEDRRGPEKGSSVLKGPTVFIIFSFGSFGGDESPSKTHPTPSFFSREEVKQCARVPVLVHLLQISLVFSKEGP